MPDPNAPKAPETLPEQERLRPTIVVGVGGIGCWIADRVYAMAHESGAADNNRIVILGFDTDANDLGELGHLKREHLIRTSTADTVFTVLDRRENAIESWFVPQEELTADIRQMTLLDGAGAIRMLSRLAFEEAMRDQAISQKLTSAVGAIATQNNRDAFPGQVNVLLLGSVAGGTGSGMFLQTALVLADTLRQMGVTPEMRGLFLLPDIVVNAARIATDQVLGVRANAYAALKELNAISRQTQGLDPGGSQARPVEFNYVQGRQLALDGRPFASLVLLDYEQQLGSHLGHNFDAYRELAARAAYTLLFTPIGGKFQSHAVNDIRVKHGGAAQGQDNRFAGIGVAALVYPQEHMLDYLCLRLGLATLEGDWLRLDHAFREELVRFQARVGNGEANLEKPVQGDFYPRQLEQLANTERVRFFQDIYRRVYVSKEDQQGRQREEVRFCTYLDALEKHLLDAFWSSDLDLKTARGREDLGADALTDKDALAADVGQFERHLRMDLEAVERGLAATVQNLFYTSVLGAATLAEAQWQDYHLESYMLRGGPHLVEVRYFLYKLRAELGTRAKGLKDGARRKAITRQLGAFDDPQTAGVETAGGIAAALAQRKLPDFVDRRFSRFGRDYREHYNLMQGMIRDLGREGTLRQVYDLLDRYLGRLLEVLERFFADLGGLAADLALERNRLEAEHGQAAGLANTNRYCFADARAKQAQWDELRARLDSAATQDQKVNAALTQALIERFREEGRPNRWQVLPPFSGAALFRHDVIERFARPLIEQNYPDVYRLTALTAIRREAMLEGLDPERHLTELVDLVAAQSAPFLALSTPQAGQIYRFWALSPANRDSLGDPSRVAALFKRNQGEEPLVEPEFPDHTLLCLSTLVDLRLMDLAKLDPGSAAATNIAARQPGAYFTAYRALVDRALAHERSNPGTPNPAFTPHLDRTWHRPGVLPEIHPQLEQAQDRDLLDAYCCGLALELLPWDTRDGRPVTLFRDWSRRGTLDYERIIADGHDDLAVLEALRQDPGSVAAILERRAALEAEPMPAGGDTLHQGLVNPATLIRIGRLMVDRTRAGTADLLAVGALSALFRHLASANERLHRQLGPNARRAELARSGADLITAAARGLTTILEPDSLAQWRAIAQGQLDLVSGD